MRFFLSGVPALLALAFALAVSTATAEPKPDVTKLEPGQAFNWRTFYGNTRVVYLGRDGRHHRFQFTRDGSNGNPSSIEFWSNRRGETVKAVINGVTHSYAPHDCTLTLGRCTYVEKTDSGLRRKMIWRARLDGEVWTYQLFHTSEHSENLLEVGKFTVDENGVYINRDYVTYYGGKRRKAWARRR